MSLKYEPASLDSESASGASFSSVGDPQPLIRLGKHCHGVHAFVENANTFKNNYFTEMCSGSEAGSYLRRIDFCITQL